MKKRIVISTVVVFAACVLLWRFIPRSADSVMPVQKEDITGFSSVCLVDPGQPEDSGFDSYRIESDSGEDQHLAEILRILKGSSYQPDFWNLVPGGIENIVADENDEGVVAVKFMCGDKNLRITFLNPTQLIIKTEKASGFRIYHPTNKQTMAMLVEYLKANGILE